MPAKSNKKRPASNPSDLAYGPPPEARWTRKMPWISIQGHFSHACSVLIIPTGTKNKKPLPPVVIVKKPHKKPCPQEFSIKL